MKNDVEGLSSPVLVVLGSISLVLFSLLGGGYELQSYNYHRILVTSLIGVATLASIADGLRGRPDRASPNFMQSEQLNRSARLLVLVLVLATGSCLISPNPLRALVDLGQFGGLAALAIYIAGHLQHGESIRVIKLLTVITCFYGLLFCGDVFLKTLYWRNGDRLTSPVFAFVNPRFCNQVMAWLSPVVLFGFLFDRGSNSFWSTIALFFVFFISFITEGRGFLLSFFIVTVIMFFFLAKNKKLEKSCALLAIVSIALACVAFVWLVTVADGGSNFLKPSSSGRFDFLWPTAINLVLEYPFFGVGARESYAEMKGVGHPHNLLLQLASEYGLLFFASFIVLLVRSVYLVREFLFDAIHNKATSLAFLFSLLCALIYSLLSGVFVMPASQLAGALIVGVLVGEGRAYYFSLIDTNKDTVSKSTKNRGYSFVPLAYWLLLVVSFVGVILHLREYYLLGAGELSTVVNHPRVWVNDSGQ